MITAWRQLNFRKSFKTKGGPDLKVYLSKMPMAELGKDNAAQTTRLSIGVLKSNKGEQLYTLPDGMFPCLITKA